MVRVRPPDIKRVGRAAKNGGDFDRGQQRVIGERHERKCRWRRHTPKPMPLAIRIVGGPRFFRIPHILASRRRARSRAAGAVSDQDECARRIGLNRTGGARTVHSSSTSCVERSLEAEIIARHNAPCTRILRRRPPPPLPHRRLLFLPWRGW